MLVQFGFKNFKSFRDDTTLDLLATKITEHADQVIQAGKEKVLPVAAIFGANASGKSNVIQAFRFMRIYVRDSFFYGGYPEGRQSERRKPVQSPFLFDAQTREAESLFEVYFVDEENGGKMYHYGFTLNKQGVVEEWLNVRAKTAREFRPVFYRGEDELDLRGLSSQNRELIRIALDKEVLIVSLGAKLKVETLRPIWKWFYYSSVVDFGNPIENVIRSERLPYHFGEDDQVRHRVAQYFSTFDDAVVDFAVEAVDEEDEKDGSSRYRVEAVHRTTDGGHISIPLKEESDGTLKMLALYPEIQRVLTSGGVLFVDELNARLHPLLVRNIVLIFLNPEINKRHAQLIFSTHDVWLMESELLRRDEIWFVEKGSDGASSLYSLSDFRDHCGDKIRKDENYIKNYMLGKYGGIPSLKAFTVFVEE